MPAAIKSEYLVKLADTQEELRQAQRLRYHVFVNEMGATGPRVDHDAGLEQDDFDPFCDHLLIKNVATGHVVGVYRLMRAEQAQRAGGFYSGSEYDLTPLIKSKREILELGRSCLHPDHRGGVALHLLWQGLGRYVADHKIDILFGVASFRGTDVHALAAPLSLLYHRHLAPAALRPKANENSFQNMNLIDEAHLDRRGAMMQMPSLIKAYLRLGGTVGDGAFVDHEFNTVDVCLIMDTAQLSARQAKLYAGASA